MATNFLGNGETITYANPVTTAGDGAISSGDGVLIGSLFGVAIADIAEGESGAVKLDGVWTLPKVSAQAWTQGDLIYWDDSASNATTDNNTAADLKVIGVAYAAAANPSSTGSVRLNGGIVN